MAKNDKDKDEEAPPFDLAARIGSRSVEPAPPPPAPPEDRGLPPRLDGPLPPRRDLRPMTIGMDEPAPPPQRSLTPILDASASEEEAAKGAAIPSPRTPPGPSEVDLIVTPLPTPDDWHRFELALRRVPGIGHGIGQIKPEYYRQGVLKVRVTYLGDKSLANALRAGVPGYRVRVIGEDRSTVQILLGEADERRPG